MERISVIGNSSKSGNEKMRPGDDFDIEDSVFAHAAEYEYDDMVGLVEDGDKKAIQEDVELADFAVAASLLKDVVDQERPNPDDIDPLKFISETVGDFISLRIRIRNIVRSVPVDMRLSFVMDLVTALTKTFRPAQINRLLDGIATD
jgi:hypothetical protein